MADFVFERLNWLTAFAALITFFNGIASAQAAPVTFQFEAEVASIGQFGDGTILPFAVAVGDKFRVEMAFEPEGPSSSHFQPFAWRFVFSGYHFEAPSYYLSVMDNLPEWVPLTGSIADPWSTPIIDRGPGGVSDAIFASCDSSFGSQYCGTLNEATSLSWRAGVSFYAESDLLGSDDLPTDPAVWNAFSFREMSLLFVDTNGTGSIILGGYVGSLREIPEPSTQLIGAICGLLLTLWPFRCEPIA